MEKKMKVVWLCHFSNNEIKHLLRPYKDVKEYAQWMPIAIKVMEGNPNVDLTIVAPYPYISHTKTLELRGVHYYFFNPGIPFIGVAWQKWFKWDYITNFSRNKRIVKQIVDKINPAVVHLFGAENPYYSATVLPLLDRYPVIATIQGFCSHAPKISGWIQKKRAAIEREILSRIGYAFYESQYQANDIKKFNPQVCLTWCFYGSYKINVPLPKPEIKYDLVFFARINREKGIVDLLDAVKLIRDKGRDKISVCIIGSASSTEFKEYAEKIGISENVEWTGFMETREDVHRKALEAKISVLPTYHDINPGTMIESMFLGIPFVAYATDNLPEVNENGPVISLVEKGNIEQLAETISALLQDEEEQRRMSKASKKRAEEMFAPSRELISNSLMHGYELAIRNTIIK